MLELTACISFDDRIHQQAQVEDLDLELIREFLYDEKSDLVEESRKVLERFGKEQIKCIHDITGFLMEQR